MDVGASAQCADLVRGVINGRRFACSRPARQSGVVCLADWTTLCAKRRLSVPWTDAVAAPRRVINRPAAAATGRY